MRNTITMAQFHKLLWEITSIAYRLDDSDNDGYVKCATCGKEMLYYGTRDAQMGHFMGRQRSSTKYDRCNQLTQCQRCNGFYGKGEQYLMGLALDKRFGKGTAYKMAILSQKHFKPTREYLKDMLVANSRMLLNNAVKKGLMHWKEGMAQWKIKLIEQLNTSVPSNIICPNYKIP